MPEKKKKVVHHEKKEEKKEPPKPPEPKAVADKACKCGHYKEDHFGGPQGWCNRGGCECQSFK